MLRVFFCMISTDQPGFLWKRLPVRQHLQQLAFHLGQRSICNDRILHFWDLACLEKMVGFFFFFAIDFPSCSVFLTAVCLSKPTYAGRTHPQNQICTLCSYRKALNSSHCVLWDGNKFFSFSFDSCSLHFGISDLLQCGFVICLCLSMYTFPALAAAHSRQLLPGRNPQPVLWDCCTHNPFFYSDLERKNFPWNIRGGSAFWTHLNKLPEQTFCSYLGNYCVRQKE